MNHTSLAGRSIARPGRHRRRLIAALALVGMVAAACGSDDDGDDGGDATTTTVGDAATTTAAGDAGDATTAPDAGGEPVTLKLSYVNDPIGADVIAAFEAAHPNIDIDASIVPFSDYVASITLTMASDDAPDIAQYNAGAMRTLIPAGELLELNSYETSMGWDAKFPKSSLDVLRTDSTAKRFGTDSLYAVPAGLSVTGMFYNKEVAEQLGITLPIDSIDALEAAFETAKAEGVSPISVGGLDYNHLHLWAALVNAMGDTDQYRAWAYGEPEATIQTDAAKAASDLMIEWAEKGYIPDTASGTSAADAAAEFSSGGVLFHLDGNWQASAFDEAMGDNVGFFLMPMADGSPAQVASGASVAWSISARTEHPDEAALFLDFMTSAEAAAAQVGAGFVPVNAAVAPTTEGVIGEINTTFAGVAENDGIMPFPDHPAPALLDLLIAGVQGLISGQMSTDDYLASLQAAWDEFHSS
jgi:ABC-type glycerol-3-phosphate transport system substrate-binding protein